MSNPRKLLAIKVATDNFERARGVLLAELDRGAPRACLEAMVELCSLYAACTGGTLVTQAFQKELAAISARVQARPHLREVAPIMNYDIEVADICPQCSAPGYVYRDGDGQFACQCSGCYDGTEDAHLASQAVGRGRSPREAVREWLEASEAHVPQNVGFWPTNVSTLARIEFQRTAGWVERRVGDAIYFGPAIDEAAE